MNYQQFVVTVKETLALSLGNDISLHTHTTLKNNGKERVGITLSDKNVNVSPTIYLEEYYRQFQDGNTINEIVESIVNVYQEVRFEHSWNVHTIKDFEFIQSKIVYKLINSQKNQVFLKNHPHLLFLDFAIVFYVLFEVDDSGSASIPITTELMNLWNTSLEEIKHLAVCNTPKLLPPIIKPMRTVIEELLGHICEDLDIEENVMFVLTNPLRNFGAICMLYEGLLEQIGNDFGENFYLLPSSIHEMILIPESKSPDRADLNDMVTEINETQLDIEDVLSEHVYYYDREKKLLS